MLTGQCRTGTKEPLFRIVSDNATSASSFSPKSAASTADILTITATLLGLLLNILSLVVFLRVFKKPHSRNTFHLFLVFLSACEISFCLTSAVTYANVLNFRKGLFIWTGMEHDSAENATEFAFRYSMHIPTGSPAVATVCYNLVVLFAYLSVVSQFARNSWVAITSLLRCYVATRRTNVQLNKVYSIKRISLVFAAQLAVVVTASLIRSCVNHGANFFNFNVHACNTSGSGRSGSYLLHVTGDQEKQRRMVNMTWTVLSQVIPLVAIITSSILLVNSLRANSSMIDSSERNKKITRMVFIFSLAFTLLEMPRALVFFLVNFLLKDRLSPTVILYAYQATYILSLTDSTVNVFIYFFNDQHFKKELCCWRTAAGSAARGGSGRGDGKQKKQQQKKTNEELEQQNRRTEEEEDTGSAEPMIDDTPRQIETTV